MSVTRKVGVVICAHDPRGDWRVLLRKNSPFNSSPEEWNVVYGHIEAEEEAVGCARREIQEETGLVADFINTSNRVISRIFPGGREISIEYFWTIFTKLPTKITLNEESIGYQWARRDEVESYIIDKSQREAVVYCLERAQE